MSSILINIKYLGEKLSSIYNSGQIPQQPKWEYTFLDDATGDLTVITDLQIKKNRRIGAIQMFLDTYGEPFKNLEISILLIVVNAKKYSGSEFIAFFKKKLRRMGLHLSFIQLRDCGKELFKEHFHFVVVLRRLTGDEISKLVRDKDDRYRVQMCCSLGAFLEYLRVKEIFAPPGTRCFSRSRRLLSIKELREGFLKNKISGPSKLTSNEQQ